METEPYDGKPADIVIEDGITWIRVKNEQLGIEVMANHAVLTASPLPDKYQIKVDVPKMPDPFAGYADFMVRPVDLLKAWGL